MASLLYLKRFQFGFNGTVHKYLASSPSYDGDKSELDFYPKYSPHTIDSLHKLKRQASCVSLSLKNGTSKMKNTKGSLQLAGY